MNYGSILKSLRERIGLSQKSIADLLNVTRPAYTQYESEYNVIPLKHLITLCDYFKVSLDYMFNLVNNKNYEVYNQSVDKVIAGKRLKEFRKENKITQDKLAQELNTTHSVIADYERGRFLISTSFLYYICNNYKISADYLLGRVDSPKYLK